MRRRRPKQKVPAELFGDVARWIAESSEWQKEMYDWGKQVSRMLVTDPPPKPPTGWPRKGG